MNCAVCGHEFAASEKAEIEQRANDTVFINTYCPNCNQGYYTHNHFNEWMGVERKPSQPQPQPKLPADYEESLNHGE